MTGAVRCVVHLSMLSTLKALDLQMCVMPLLATCPINFHKETFLSLALCKRLKTIAVGSRSLAEQLLRGQASGSDHAGRRRPRHDARFACAPDPGFLRHPDRQSLRLAG